MQGVAGSNPASSTKLSGTVFGEIRGIGPGKKPVAYWFYVLRSGKDGRLYKGVTQDLERRLAQHNAGKTKSLRHRRPFTLVYREQFASREDAMARERWSKTSAGGKRVQELVGDAGSPARTGEPGTG